MKSNLILFLLGIFLCAAPTLADETIVLTEKNHITFSGPVNDKSVATAQVELGKLSSTLPAGAIIYLVLDTPGGSVSAGNLFIDFAKSLPQQIRPICIFCASMGYHMFQSFADRIVYPSSTLMSHRASLGGLSGQVPGELESRLANIKRILIQMDERVASRLGLSVMQYRTLIYDELWLDGVSAVKLGHADRTSTIRCSNDLLKGTKTETIRTIFGPVTVTTSTCPLISGFLDIRFGREHFRSEVEAVKAVRKAKRSVMWSF